MHSLRVRIIHDKEVLSETQTDIVKEINVVNVMCRNKAMRQRL